MTATTTSPRAWLMWALCVVAYASAVFQRTSFGVASASAAERFASGASLTSLFVVVQLITYAAMQVPVGLLVDRLGTRVVVGAGAVLMCLGQVALAVSPDLASAILARILVGAGDAMTFTAVLRLLPAWFAPRQIPMLNQLTSMLGQTGQLASSLPFAALLGAAGWTQSFAAAAAVSAAMAALVLALVRNAPDDAASARGARQRAREQVADVLGHSASRVAFWIHWMCAFWPMVFTLMWGYPFLLVGQGLSPRTTAGLFTVYVFAGAPAAILVGFLSRRAPVHRVTLALLFSLLAVVPWAAVLLLPGPAPLWLLVALMIGLAAAGPGSSIGFDVARAANPLRDMGTASGLVVASGFTATVIGVFAIGAVLDLLGGPSPSAFRWAMSAQFALWGVGVAGVYAARRRARAEDRRRGVRYPTVGSVLAREARAIVGAPPAASDAARVSLRLGDGRVVHVAAVLPGTGNRLVAVDVPPPGATPEWWRRRVQDYLDVVGTAALKIGSVEVRCPTRAARDATVDLVDDALAGRELPHEVVVVGHLPG